MNSNQSQGGKKRGVRRRFQTGSWRKRNGVWSCKYRTYPQQPDGTHITKWEHRSFSGLSQRAAKAAMQPVLNAINSENASDIQPVLIQKKQRTLNDLIAEWRALIAPHRKPRGLKSTECNLRAHIIPALGDKLLREIDTRSIQSFVNRISIPSRSGKTVENIVLTLTGILNSMHKLDKQVPVIRLCDLAMPAKVKALPRFLTGAQIKRLIKEARGTFRTILLVLATTGMRINEVLALRIEDIDFEREVIHVRSSLDPKRELGTPKSKASIADVPLCGALARELKKYLKSKHYRENAMNLLFANRRMRPYADSKLREKCLQPLLRKLGMEQVGFHAIRHGVASELLNSGTPINVVRDQLRHSDVRITLGIYGHTIGDAQRKAVEGLSQLVA